MLKSQKEMKRRTVRKAALALALTLVLKTMTAAALLPLLPASGTQIIITEKNRLQGDWAWVSGMPRDRVPVMSPQEKPGKEKEAAQQRLLLGVRLALVLHSPPEKNAAR